MDFGKDEIHLKKFDQVCPFRNGSPFVDLFQIGDSKHFDRSVVPVQFWLDPTESPKVTAQKDAKAFEEFNKKWFVKNPWEAKNRPPTQEPSFSSNGCGNGYGKRKVNFVEGNTKTSDHVILREIRTIPGEKFFNSLLGTDIRASLFENFTPTTVTIIEDQIRATVRNFEPRVGRLNIEVDARPDLNSLQVKVIFTIKGLEAPPQSFTFFLEPTR